MKYDNRINYGFGNKYRKYLEKGSTIECVAVCKLRIWKMKIE